MGSEGRRFTSLPRVPAGAAGSEFPGASPILGVPDSSRDPPRSRPEAKVTLGDSGEQLGELQDALGELRDALMGQGPPFLYTKTPDRPPQRLLLVILGILMTMMLIPLLLS